jgi:hypothetical protein
MGKLIDRAKERIGRVKADRSTEMGIAGHKAAMAAYDRQIDTPLKYMDSNHWPPARTPDFRPVGPGDEMIVPGMGHVTEYNVNTAASGRYRGIDLTRRGTAGIGDPRNTTASYEKKFFDNRAAKKAKKDVAAGIEPNVIDRHKPTEDF